MSKKPLGRKNYGHIPHLPGSRMGPADHHCEVGQARIATAKKRDRNDEIIVQEKLDGSNVGIARIGDQLHALTRAGYPALSSPYEQHHLFDAWVTQQRERFMAVLLDGERLVGEWLALAHGTRYRLMHEPFVPFDLMREAERTPYDQFLARIQPGAFVLPYCIHRGEALSIDAALACIGYNARTERYGYHGALEPVEGVIWRVERDRPTGRKGEKVRVVDFLVKYVRPDKVDGKYLPELSGHPPQWNWHEHE